MRTDVARARQPSPLKAPCTEGTSARKAVIPQDCPTPILARHPPPAGHLLPSHQRGGEGGAAAASADETRGAMPPPRIRPATPCMMPRPARKGCRCDIDGSRAASPAVRFPPPIAYCRTQRGAHRMPMGPVPLCRPATLRPKCRQRRLQPQAAVRIDGGARTARRVAAPDRRHCQRTQHGLERPALTGGADVGKRARVNRAPSPCVPSALAMPRNQPGACHLMLAADGLLRRRMRHEREQDVPHCAEPPRAMCPPLWKGQLARCCGRSHPAPQRHSPPRMRRTHLECGPQARLRLCGVDGESGCE